jgi:hypothetical protein
MDVTRVGQQLDWCNDVLEAASHAAGLGPRLAARSYGLRDDLEQIQFAFLDRFQSDGEKKMIDVVRRTTELLSTREPNAVALTRFARAASVLDAAQGTDLMLRFRFEHPLPPLPSEW